MRSTILEELFPLAGEAFFEMGQKFWKRGGKVTIFQLPRHRLKGGVCMPAKNKKYYESKWTRVHERKHSERDEIWNKPLIQTAAQVAAFGGAAYVGALLAIALLVNK